jgi:hypothetical protein
MDPSLLRDLVGLGVGGVLAGFIFAAYRRDAQGRDREKTDEIKLLVEVVRSNTAAMTELSDRVKDCPARGR